jgi:transcription elongation factor B subunit 1
MAANGQELSKYVTLISSDGFEFVVLREAACVSGAIKRMLDPKSTYIRFCPEEQAAKSS